MNPVSLAEKFEARLADALIQLSSDEWAVTKVGSQLIEGLSPQVAFQSIVSILKLACKQEDPYAFSYCCWFARDLMALSDTTEIPVGFIEVANSLASVASALDCKHEVNVICGWYRFTT
ncbi:MAG: hypothetical protein ABIZ64_05310 [Casimicrobium sp.]